MLDCRWFECVVLDCGPEKSAQKHPPARLLARNDLSRTVGAFPGRPVILNAKRNICAQLRLRNKQSVRLGVWHFLVIEVAMQKALPSRLEHDKKPFDNRLADIFILKITSAKQAEECHIDRC